MKRITCRTGKRREGPVQIWRETPTGRREIVRPDPCQGGLVLAAVKAWPNKRQCGRGPAATASLDGVSTRGQRQIMGRDEETGFSGRTKKRSTSSCFFVRPSAVSSSRPANARTPREDAVKAGRRAGSDTRCGLARPRLDGGEHGVKLAAVGLREVSANRVRCCPI